MFLAVLSAVLVTTAAVGHRMEALPFGPAFLLLTAGLVSAVVAFAWQAWRLWQALTRRRPGHPMTLALSLVLTGTILVIPAGVVGRARLGSAGLPAIHDISTDTADPPVFIDVLPLRAGAPNSAVYGGALIAAEQQRAYPGVRPLWLKTPPDAAFDGAMQAVADMGWDIAGSNRAQGRIEATATTFWFGFRDDVVIRLRPDAAGTRVDVRSVSRVGTGDVGANATRIRQFLARLGSG